MAPGVQPIAADDDGDKGRLPDTRAVLYEETIDILLWRWEQVKISTDDAVYPLRLLLAAANRSDVDLKRVLWQLAFEAHRAGGTVADEDNGKVADIGELSLTKALSQLHPDNSWDWARQVVEVMKLRAGLLIEGQIGVYTFPHRTFQEYLAGSFLSTQADFSQYATQLVQQGALWREVVLLAVGRLVYLSGDTAKPLALVAELCPAQSEATDVAWRQAWLAGDVLLEMGRNRVADSTLGRELSQRVSQRLVSLLQEERLSPVERAAAGDTLGRLGDPRFRTDAWYLPADDLLGFVEIPEGPFVMGEGQEQHELTLPSYDMARYPVTVAQWQVFIEDSGYRPEDADSLQGLPNHPVVRVMWDEMLKYCGWLTERLRAWEETPEPLKMLLRAKGWQVTLPSEAEWEKAARGQDGRIYPWGNTFDSNRANVEETGLGTRSAVGCFPDGASPYGIMDLSGNVWEWTRSVRGMDCQELDLLYPYRPKDGREDLNASDNSLRVWRGGGFFSNQGNARCAFRRRLGPVLAVDRGFRVVVLPPLNSETPNSKNFGK